MKIPFVDLKIQYQNIKSEIDEAIQSVIDNTAFISGKYVNEFATNFARNYGVKHMLPVANGTDAIYIALKMLGIGIGDEVITTACTWISTGETISQTGAKPVFVDINNKYLIDENLIESKITSKTKAIIPVHLYGQMANITFIKEICDKHNLFLIEDCAQSHYAEYHNQRAGTIGDVGTFSFFPGKNLGAYGDAGGIITNNDKLAEKMKMYANHGALVKHQHKIEGINSRMDGLQGAILNVKLKYIEKWTEMRRSNASIYSSLLKDIKQVKTPISYNNNSKHAYHLFVIDCESRDSLSNYLNDKGIATAIHYPTPLPFMDAYSYLEHTEEDFPIAAKTKKRILSLPMYPELTKTQIEYICDAIKSFYN